MAKRMRPSEIEIPRQRRHHVRLCDDCLGANTPDHKCPAPYVGEFDHPNTVRTALSAHLASCIDEFADLNFAEEHVLKALKRLIRERRRCRESARPTSKQQDS